MSKSEWNQDKNDTWAELRGLLDRLPVDEEYIIYSPTSENGDSGYIAEVLTGKVVVTEFLHNAIRFDVTGLKTYAKSMIAIDAQALANMMLATEGIFIYRIGIIDALKEI